MHAPHSLIYAHMPSHQFPLPAQLELCYCCGVQAEARHAAAVASAELAGQHHPHAAAALQLIVAGVQPIAL